MSNLWLSLIFQWVPFLLLYYMAVEIFLRNPNNKLHRLTTILIFLLGVIYLLIFLQHTVSIDSVLDEILYIKYIHIFLLMTLSLYFFREISRVSFHPILKHTICLLPMVSVILYLMNSEWREMSVMEIRGLRIEQIHPEFYLWIMGFVGYLFILILFFLVIAVKRVNQTTLVKERYRLKTILRGAVITGVYLAISLFVVNILEKSGVYYLSFLPSLCILIWAYSIRYAMVKFDLLASQGQRYELLFKMSQQGIVLLDEQGTILEANPAFRRLSKTQECKGLGFTAFLRHSDQAKFSNKFLEFYETTEGFQFETAILNKQEESYFVIVHVEYVEIDGKYYAYAVIQDISNQKINEQKLSHLAYQDSLTKLCNRRKYLDVLKSALVEVNEDNKKIAVMILDLNQFKSINDTFGHSAGDMLLQYVAEQLEKNIPLQGIAARLGGDEFAVILPISDKNEATVFVNKVLQSMDNSINISGEEYSVSASIGISISPADGKDLETLMRNADIAMYAAKKKGRNQYQLFEKIVQV